MTSAKKALERALYGEGLLGEAMVDARGGALAERFTLPPLTVLNAREGWWQDRKRAWIGMGIQSELGRGDDGDEPPAPRPVAQVPKQLTPTAPGSVAVQVAQKKRFGMPAITVTGSRPTGPTAERKPLPTPAAIDFVNRWQDPDQPMRYDADTWDADPPRSAIGMDVECFENFFLVCFKRFADGKRVAFELSERSTLDRAGLKKIFDRECIITFNGATYDVFMVLLALKGLDVHALKQASDAIILERLSPWATEKRFGVKVPRSLNHVDLSGSNPSVRQGLKTLGARLHAPTLLNLPFDPAARLTRKDMNVATVYCMNDLDQTELLFDALREPLALRQALTKQYGVDMRSKSDAQVGEAIVKKRIETLTGNTIRRREPGSGDGHWFSYRVPDFVSFTDPALRDVLDVVRRVEFSIDGYERVVMPKELEGRQVTLGGTTYSMGIGGLHSTEQHRAVHSDSEHVLVDADVASQYPKIIMKLGMYPKGAGPRFLEVYGGIIDERLGAKVVAAQLDREIRAAKARGEEVDPRTQAVKDAAQARADGGKIAANGVYGKLGSPYSFLYAPDIMIAVTLTGQLSLLMLIERAVAAGIQVVSGNTDGVVFRCPRSMVGFNDKHEVESGALRDIIRDWEEATGFEVETAAYRSIFNASVNTYVAVREDGKVKRKGPVANPWAEGDLRGQLSKNPQVCVASDAVVERITKGTGYEEYVRSCTDIRMFLTSIKVTGGATWRGGGLGNVVRYYWSRDGEPILYVKETAAGNTKKVAKTDGAKPVIELPSSLPDDIDYDRYVAEAHKIAVDIGAASDNSLTGR